MPVSPRRYRSRTPPSTPYARRSSRSMHRSTSSVRSRSGPSSPARRFVGGVARNIVGSLPYGGAAVAAYDGIQAMRGVRSRTASSKTRFSGNGKHSGKFKKPKISKSRNLFIAKGFQHTTEINGQVSDPNVVYIGHTTMSGFQTTEVIAQCLLRKLFERAGMQVTGVKQNIEMYSTPSSNGWMLELVLENKQTGVRTNIQHPIVGTTTIYALCGSLSETINPGWNDYMRYLREYASGTINDSIGNVLVPTLLRLYREEGNTTIFWQIEASLNLQNEIIHLQSSSSIKVQNRSLDAAGSTSTDTVSSNPIGGRLYHFSSGVPRARVPGVHLLETMYDATGVLSARGAQFGAAADGFKEPPHPSMFWNCSGNSKIKLQPGDLKSDTIHYERKGPLLKVLRGLGFGSGNGGVTGHIVNVAGRCAVIALEDFINVSSTADITIAYEVNRKFGAYSTTSPQKSATGTVYALTHNNVSPP